MDFIRVGFSSCLQQDKTHSIKWLSMIYILMNNAIEHAHQIHGDYTLVY